MKKSLQKQGFFLFNNIIFYFYENFKLTIMMKISVLGAGLVGKAIAVDLYKKFDVSSFDIDESALNFLEQTFGIKTKVIDLSNHANIVKAVSDADIVVNALPGFMGFETLKTIINTAKNVVDIFFFPVDSF